MALQVCVVHMMRERREGRDGKEGEREKRERGSDVNHIQPLIQHEPAL